MKPHICKRYGEWSVAYQRNGVPMFAISWDLPALFEGIAALQRGVDLIRWEPRPAPVLVVAQNGLPHVDIITCDSVQEARDLVNLACAETVGGCQ